MQVILEHLHAIGEQTSAQISKALKLPVAGIEDKLKELKARGDVITCDRIRIRGSREIRETLYRAQGYIPPKAPGPKPK